jgi:sec-independent protein translocase protein TatB
MLCIGPSRAQAWHAGKLSSSQVFVSAMRGKVSLSLMGIPPTIEVANLGMADSLILMVMALVVFGPRRLPQIGRQIGKLMYEFRKASNDFKFQMEEELRNAEEADRRKKEEEERQRQLAANPPAQLEASTPTTPETPATESSYPYGKTYGEITNEQEAAAASAPAIEPPSTGEPVPAAWPANDSTEPDAPADTEASKDASSEASSSEASTATPESYAAPVAEPTPVEKENAVIETAVEDTNKATEPAAHNG